MTDLKGVNLILIHKNVCSPFSINELQALILTLDLVSVMWASRPKKKKKRGLKCPLGWQNTLNCPLGWLKHDKLPSWEPKRALKCPFQWREHAVFSPLPFKKSVNATGQRVLLAERVSLSPVAKLSLGFVLLTRRVLASTSSIPSRWRTPRRSLSPF